ncbi:hypothetical protein [Aquimarina celericrescens]|uniref:Uncharacterized protein n=1 Tax=Aquimarina celericrescens TaxID=1964542 RepID=A0ABW5AZU8_9FLAO|nr:hypothetical protein [Aquimarina celericrescens]
MKNHHLKTIAVLFIGLLYMVSCEKSDLTTETNQILEVDEVNNSSVAEQNEGFRSTTGNHGGGVLENPEILVKPVLEMSFDKDVPEEEVRRQFDAAVQNHKSKQSGRQNKNSTSKEFVFSIRLKTGKEEELNQSHTFGDVAAHITFETNAGYLVTDGLRIDEAGNIPGETRYHYGFSMQVNEPVEWVRVVNGVLHLNGTDGWLVKEFGCYMFNASWDQFSYFNSVRDVWLDNTIDAPNVWDSYYTGDIGEETIYF